jgi:hypothetical protein
LVVVVWIYGLSVSNVKQSGDEQREHQIRVFNVDDKLIATEATQWGTLDLGLTGVKGGPFLMKLMNGRQTSAPVSDHRQAINRRIGAESTRWQNRATYTYSLRASSDTVAALL